MTWGGGGGGVEMYKSTGDTHVYKLYRQTHRHTHRDTHTHTHTDTQADRALMQTAVEAVKATFLNNRWPDRT